ncbi:5-oxoprolinase subunit PxpB [Crenobacter cavernae]|uniref:5-oxoprolinase subunit PxpB n=1 Tax=Crenobacter cavernae TaxID=2290923 RepID=A0ABY0FH11_9NEIS|nr:5-oxoprolinase subunit PxpB [Crenobacter cavernae]RXZ45681.1 5-oxoprolinase subunit PxpB [Crenobacter cavernae]
MEGEVRFYLMGERAAVLASRAPASLPCQRRIWWIADRLHGDAGLIDIVPGMNNLTLIFDPLSVDGKALLDRLRALWLQEGQAEETSREVSIPVSYGGTDGPDLGEVSHHTGLNEEEVIARHSGAEYVVYFLGFQPGFAYLGGLPESLVTPRRAEPRLAVPAGSVGIGGSQTGIYPAVTPGGWQIIGRTEVPLFAPSLCTPTLLLPGDRVRFIPVAADRA